MCHIGTPDRIRTYDLWLRKPTLYPAELRVHRLETKPDGFSQRSFWNKSEFAFGGLLLLFSLT
jgi:hypothetical protein